MSNDSLTRLLGDIDEFASTVDPWETNSSRSTIGGLGSLTGRGLMNVGVGILRGVTGVGLRRALVRIAAAQKQSSHSLSREAYRDIVEYQRPGLYTRHINMKAWSCLLLELYRGHGGHIAEALFHPEMTLVDVQLCIQQLAACALTDWTCYPRTGLDPIPLSMVVSLSDPLDANGGDVPHATKMHARFLRFLSLLLRRNPALIREILDFGTYSDIVLTSWQQFNLGLDVPGFPGTVAARILLSRVFLSSLIWRDSAPRGIGKNSSWDILHSLAIYLTADSNDLLAAIAFITQTFTDWIADTDHHDDEVYIPSMLDLTGLLCVKSEAASTLLFNEGVLDLVEKLFALFQSGSLGQFSCCRLLGALAFHPAVQFEVVHYLILKTPSFPVLDHYLVTSVRNFFLPASGASHWDWTCMLLADTEGDEHAMQRGLVDRGSGNLDLDREPLMELMLVTMEQLSEKPPVCRTLYPGTSWQYLIAVLSLELEPQDFTHPRPIDPVFVTARIALRAIVLTQEHWEVIVEIFHNAQTRGLHALTFIISRYLLNPPSKDDYASISNRTKAEIRDMYELARSRQLPICYPSDALACFYRRLLSSSQGHSPSPSIDDMDQLSAAGSLYHLEYFIDEIQRRSFDFVSHWTRLTDSERQLREETVDQLRAYISEQL